MDKLMRSALIAAGLGGLLWASKALIITARDGSFDPAESWFFIGGLLAILTANLLAAVAVGRRTGGLRGAGAGLLTAVALLAAMVAVESLGKGVVSGLASGQNLGLEEEGGILAVGLVWLLAAVAMRVRPRARPQLAPAR